jgi:hypothetical protein
VKLIETKTLTVAAASIEFTSIPQGFTDLVMLVSVNSATNDQNLNMRFNDSTTNYSGRNLLGTGSSVASQTNAGSGLQIVSTKSTTSNTFVNCQVYIPNYASSANKSVSSDGVSEANATAAYIQRGATQTTGFTTASLITNNNIYVLAQNNNGAAAFFTPYQVCMYMIADAFTTTEASNFNTNYSAVITALSR